MPNFEHILLLLPGIIVGFTVHEFAHAFVASRLGDDTAKEMGRFTLNPLKHIDPVGFLLLIVAGFGWAKPVLIDRSRLRNPRRDDILISVAGPASNLLLSIAGTALLAIALFTAPPAGVPVYTWVLHALTAGIYVNLGLAVFNLIPIPPLDGSHVLLQALNIKDEVNIRLFYKYGTILLLAVIVAEQALRIDILPIGKVVSALAEMLLTLFGIGK